MSNAMLYEDYLRQQCNKSTDGICAIPVDIAWCIASWIETNRDGNHLRLLTLEEAVRGDDLSWIEINVDGGPRNFGHWTDCYRDPNGENYVISAWAGGNNWLDPEQYGRTWRCWSQRPSEEERKAAAWEA